MKTAQKVVATLFAAASLITIGAPAQAADCVKGAVVGGVAGHFLGGHPLIGAGAGCLIAQHRANHRPVQHASRHVVHRHTA